METNVFWVSLIGISSLHFLVALIDKVPSKSVHWKIDDGNHRSSRPKVILGKGVLKICSKFTGEHSYQSLVSIKLLCNFIEITLWHGCSPENLLHIFWTPFPKITFGRLLLWFPSSIFQWTILDGIFWDHFY